MNEHPTLLDFLRHGEPVGGHRFRGHGVDDVLSEKGWEQMRRTSATIEGWQHIISSPLRRCADFAQWLADQRALPLTICDDFREVGFGSWEGKRRDELEQHHAGEYAAFYVDPVNNRPAGAEPLDVFGARVAGAIDRLLDAHSGQHLLVVAHAGVIRAAFGHLTRAPAANWYRAEVSHAGLTRFARDQQGLKLIAHNWRPSL